MSDDPTKTDRLARVLEVYLLMHDAEPGSEAHDELLEQFEQAGESMTSEQRKEFGALLEQRYAYLTPPF